MIWPRLVKLMRLSILIALLALANPGAVHGQDTTSLMPRSSVSTTSIGSVSEAEAELGPRMHKSKQRPFAALTSHQIVKFSNFTDTRAGQRNTPRWVKWGLLGAAAGAVTFAILGRSTIDEPPNPVMQDAALGAVAGFVVIGGGVALYDAVCGPDSTSRRAGLC